MTATRCAVDLSERNKVHRTDSGDVAVHQTGLCGWAVPATATASNCTNKVYATARHVGRLSPKPVASAGNDRCITRPD